MTKPMRVDNIFGVSWIASISTTLISVQIPTQISGNLVARDWVYQFSISRFTYTKGRNTILIVVLAVVG